MSNDPARLDAQGAVRARPAAGGWRVARTAFLGENVTLATADPHAGGWYAALNLGHFGVKLKYSPDGGATWEDRAVPAYPEGETIATGDGKPPAPATLKLIWALESGGPDGRLWAGTAPRRAVPLRRRRPELGAGPRPVGPAGAGQAGSAAGTTSPGIHSICLRPARPEHPARRRLVRRRVADRGRRRDVAGDRPTGMFAEYMPPELRGRPDDPGRPHDDAVPRGAGPPVGAAPQRRLPLDRRRQVVDRGAERGAVGVRVRRGGPPARPADGVVRPGGEGRVPGAGGRQAGGEPAPATAARRSRCCATGCRRSTPTTWCTGTPWRWTRPATGWRSARRPAGCGCPRTRATVGRGAGPAAAGPRGPLRECLIADDYSCRWAESSRTTRPDRQDSQVVAVPPPLSHSSHRGRGSGLFLQLPPEAAAVTRGICRPERPVRPRRVVPAPPPPPAPV